MLKAQVRKFYDSRASNRAGPLQDPEAETHFAPALMPSSPVAAPAAEAASPKCQASEPPDGAGSPTYARLLEKARRGYLEAWCSCRRRAMSSGSRTAPSERSHYVSTLSSILLPPLTPPDELLLIIIIEPIQ